MIPLLIIGAGVAGLTLARRTGAPVLEKSRGVGGRLATRRIGEERFDHGLQAWPEDKVCREVFSGTAGPQGITAIAKALAEGVDVRKEERARRLVQISGGWRVETDKGEHLARQVALSAPVPQALELLAASDLPTRPEWQLPYDKALVGLFLLDARKPSDASFERAGHALHFQGEKDLAATGVTLIASAQFSELHFEDEDTKNLQRLKGLLAELLGERNLKHAELKKWRYSRARLAHELPYLEAAPGLFLFGDGFLTPTVAGAIRSAQELARRLS